MTRHRDKRGERGIEPKQVGRLWWEAWAKAYGLPPPQIERVFHPERKWRWDLCWEVGRVKLAVEIHGGTWTGGRHVRGKGFKADREKVFAGQTLGWLVLEVTTEDVKSGELARLVMETFKRLTKEA